MNVRARGPAVIGLAMFLAGPTALLGGCVSARNTLGTSSSPCYRAVPVASEAVHDHGTLAGIRLVAERELTRHPKILQELTDRAGHRLTQVCILSFHGDFRVTDVDRPIGTGPPGGNGPVAVVVVSNPQNRLLGTYVVTKEPLRLRHQV